MAKHKFGKIGVLMGGYSSEREISLKSGKAVYQALQGQKCEVSALDIDCRDEQKIAELIRSAHMDVAFITLHGCLGEDGTIQSILEKMGVPYTGSRPEAHRLAIDKTITQKIFREHGIPIPEHKVISKDERVPINEIWNCFKGVPVIVKPACEGSSIGVTVVREENDLQSALDQAFQYGPYVLVERYIDGRELTVGILNEQALPIVEIRPKNNFFDFTAKYQKGMSEYIVPAPIPEPVARKIQTLAVRGHVALGCRHLSRVDVILDERLNPFFLEVNTIPGFTSTSLLPMAAQCVGINFDQLCIQLIELAYGKKE